MKKIFTISTILFSFLVILYFFYGFFVKGDDFFLKKGDKKTSENVELTEVENKDISKEKVLKENRDIAPGKIIKIFDKEVVSPTIDSTGKKIVFYSKGAFWELSFDGFFRKKITEENIPDLKLIIWSPNKKDIVLKIGNNFYNYKYSENPKKIKDGINYLTWSNLGDKIIYTYGNDKKQELDISEKNGSNWKKIATIGTNKIISPIPQTSLVSFWNYPDAKKISALKVVSVTGGSEEIFFDNKDDFGVNYLWSPNGEKFLVGFVSKKDKGILRLQVKKVSDDKAIGLNFPTLVSKCVWSKDNKNVYCALPSEIPEKALMPNDYFDSKFYTTDSFWKINTVSGKKERIVKLENITDKIDATNLFLSPNEDILFFVNRRNNNLYRITL